MNTPKNYKNWSYTVYNRYIYTKNKLN
jgi:hypothetical protein